MVNHHKHKNPSHFKSHPLHEQAIEVACPLLISPGRRLELQGDQGGTVRKVERKRTHIPLPNINLWVFFLPN
jgi:hypothetical protein